MALLFADAEGFSGLDEEGNLTFVHEVLGGVASAMQGYAPAVAAANTWGDAVFLALADVEAAAHLALDVQDRVGHGGAHGRLGFRIGLHAGPVRVVEDPVTRRRRVAGAQISTAARIEPIVPVGEVYASEAFAALSRSRGARGYECVYVGTRPWAKAFGRNATWHVRRTRGQG
jgi:hypothetical protein